MKKKIHIAAAIAVISLFNLTGLSACASETTSAVEMQADEEAPMGQRGTMAQVTAVDGSTITIVESAAGGRGGRNGGGPKSEGLEGEAPELPEGEEFDGEAPEKPDGEAPGGEMKEMPEGEAPDGEAPEKPDGEAPDGEAPEKPDGKAPDGEYHERADGETPEMTFDGEEKTITVSDSIIFTEADGEKTQASLSDISEGTIIMITYDEDGTTPTEIIIRQ